MFLSRTVARMKPQHFEESINNINAIDADILNHIDIFPLLETMLDTAGEFHCTNFHEYLNSAEMKVLLYPYLIFKANHRNEGKHRALPLIQFRRCDSYGFTPTIVKRMIYNSPFDSQGIAPNITIVYANRQDINDARVHTYNEDAIATANDALERRYNDLNAGVAFHYNSTLSALLKADQPYLTEAYVQESNPHCVVIYTSQLSTDLMQRVLTLLNLWQARYIASLIDQQEYLEGYPPASFYGHLVEYLKEQKYAEYLAALHEYRTQYYEKFISDSHRRDFLQSFTATHRATIRALEDTIYSSTQRIEQKEYELRDAYKLLAERRRDLALHLTRNAEEGADELYDLITKSKIVTYEDTADGALGIVVRTELKDWDVAYAQAMYDNPNNTVLQTKKVLRALYKAIFIDATIGIAFKQKIFWNLSAGYVQRASSGYYSENCIVNPHIGKYNCFGTYGNEISRLTLEGKYEEALFNIIASVSSLNLLDSPVTNWLLNELTQTRADILRDHETGEVFSPHTFKERYYASIETNEQQDQRDNLGDTPNLEELLDI